MNDQTTIKQLLKLLVVGAIACCLWSWAAAAEAATCKVVDGHQVCIVQIERSAKNYWEYRAVVRIDQQTQPRAVYNCRDRIRLQADGSVIPFRQDLAAALVCRLYKA